eukprot:3732513-Rhodomonas_salina.1
MSGDWILADGGDVVLVVSSGECAVGRCAWDVQGCRGRERGLTAVGRGEQELDEYKAVQSERTRKLELDIR